MDRILKIFINFRIKFLVPVLMTLGIVFSFIAILFIIYFILGQVLENYVKYNLIHQKEFIYFALKNINKETNNFNNDNIKHLFLSENLYLFWVLDLNTNKVILSNYSDDINKDLKELISNSVSPNKFIWQDIVRVYAKSSQVNHSIYKINNRYFFIKNLHEIDPELDEKKVLIITYELNWMNFISNKTIGIVIVIFFMLIFLPFWFYMYIYKRFYQTRIEMLLNGISKLSYGDLTYEIKVAGNDEISFISNFINHMKDRLKEVLYEDGLTKVLNRKGFEFFAEKKLVPGRRFAIFFMDLDGFKYINETYGHHVGDHALQLVSIRLRNLCNMNLIDSDLVLGRIGGDEFAILINLDKLKEPLLDIQIFALRIIDEISQKYQLNDLVLHLGISIGIAMYPEHGLNLDELLTNADLAMYEVKYSIKNSYYFFDLKIKSTYEKKNHLRNELIRIFRNGQIKHHFYIEYQPVYSLKRNEFSHLETLLRFTHPEILASPIEFIPLLEELKFMPEIGRFIFEETIKSFLEIRNEISKDLSLSINVSYLQMIDKNFYKEVQKIYNVLLQNHISPDRVIFEITESAFIKEPNKVIRVMNSLNDYGFLFAIDDFGTGYSSLGYLKNLPLNYLKIDKTFIKDIVINPKSELIVRSIIHLAKTLNLHIIVEGIEDYITLKKMYDLNCDYIQGYYISKPLPKEEIISLIKNFSPLHIS